MGTVPRIESTNLSIADLFRDFYSVPDFQREYVWKHSNVEKLIDDIYYELYDSEQPIDDSEYFLGSIVVFRDKDGTFQLIDGQQRMTTIYLIFCVLRDTIRKLGQESKVLDNLIAGVTPDLQTGEDVNKYRLSLHYDSDGAAFLEEVANGRTTALKRSNIVSSSVEKLSRAIETIQDFISNRFIAEARDLKKFSSMLTNNVKLIRIETPNLKNALKVFETINDRGVGLTPIDLLKNYLFISVSQKTDSNPTWQKLKGRWETLMKTLYKHQEEPIRFLRYYLMSHYDVNLHNNFPEEEIYDWFVEQSSKYSISNEPLKFVDELIIASEHYCYFTQGKNTDGTDNQYLQNIKKLQGRYRQHFILLLAGRFLEKDLFSKLCYYVESLLFIYTITRSSRRKDVNLIRNFSQWSRELRRIRDGEELVDFINKYFHSEFEPLRYDFESAFSELTDSNIAKFRLRYILAKIAQFVEKEAYDNYKPLTWYLDQSIHIEHILPKSQNNELRQSFDKPKEYDSYTKNIGNLTLLEKTINSSIIDRSYEFKKDGYQQSQILITRALVSKLNVGQNTQLNRVIEILELYPFVIWDSKTIEKRQKMLVNLAKKVWGFIS
ncbi:MAG TPA: DUF262 domain-containing protein [Cyanobacteria bacterium UBA11162]|nr:DUF262 domain-containing protein [Cyanobacteria bacterium UBA11162]